MDLHKSHDTPSAASGIAQTQAADCGASSEAAPVILDADHGRAIVPHRSGGGAYVIGPRRIGISTAHILALTMIGAASATETIAGRELSRPGAAQDITGRSRSRAYSQQVEEARRHQAQLRSEHPTRRYAEPIPPLPKSQQDLDRLAAAQAKRDRRAAKRIGAQP
jgi:hypothetical protein